jgi:pimeloyl-ACP methyl ester carboxylesterase
MPAFYNAPMQGTETLALSSRWLDASGVRVHALVREGPRPVVFVHGLSASSAHFADAADRGELEGRGIVAIDLPGFGETKAPEGFGYSMREQADVFVSLVESAGLDEVTIVGHSMGGTIVVLASEALGDRVSSVVLAEAILVFDETLWSERISSSTLDDWRIEFAGICRRPEVYARGSLMRRRKASVERITPCITQTTAEAMHASATDLKAVARDPAVYERFLEMQPQPVYVFGELHDTTGFCRRVRADGARVAVVPRSGHLMMLDNPDGFYAIVAGAATGRG